MTNTKFRFRCIANPSVIYTPQYMHDVEAMRKHSEYQEVDENGDAVKTFEEENSVQRVPMSLSPSPEAKRALGKPRKS